MFVNEVEAGVDLVLRHREDPLMAAKNASRSDQVRALLGTGMSAADIAKKVGCTPNLVYVIKSKAGASAKRGLGRPPRARSTSSGLDGLAGILEAVKDNEIQRAKLRGALEKIQAVLADALA
jgi:transposase-like protein